MQNIQLEAAGKIIGQEEMPPRNSWFDKECQILEYKKRAYNKMINKYHTK